MTDDKDALLPCPFPDCCAGLITGFQGDEDGGYGFVECKSTGHFCGIHAATESDAIAAWNHRITAALEGGKDGGWIPVSERLPEEGDEVLLLHDKVCRTAGFRKGGRYSSDDGVFPICNVTAWQPLPALPKEK